MRRLTASFAIAATGLNIVLFVDAAGSRLGGIDLAGAVVAAVNAFLPGRGGLQPPTETPQPGGRPVATSGGS